MNAEINRVNRENCYPWMLLKDGKFLIAFTKRSSAMEEMDKEVQRNPTSVITLVRRMEQSVPFPKPFVEIEVYDESS